MTTEKKPFLTISDVRLAAGELNRREAVAVEWAIGKYEAELERREAKYREVMQAACDAIHRATDYARTYEDAEWKDGERVLILLKSMGIEPTNTK